jgi:ubiquinone/menaquinone biosynthesis C-methylase UbiE
MENIKSLNRVASFHGVTCSHAFYELKGMERTMAIEEVARVLKIEGRFCLMEHAKPEKPSIDAGFIMAANAMNRIAPMGISSRALR